MSNEKVCEIINDQFSMILKVDGQKILFQGISNGEYFKQHYEELGYRVVVTDNIQELIYERPDFYAQETPGQPIAVPPGILSIINKEEMTPEEMWKNIKPKLDAGIKPIPINPYAGLSLPLAITDEDGQLERFSGVDRAGFRPAFPYHFVGSKVPDFSHDEAGQSESRHEKPGCLEGYVYKSRRSEIQDGIVDHIFTVLATKYGNKKRFGISFVGDGITVVCYHKSPTVDMVSEYLSKLYIMFMPHISVVSEYVKGDKPATT